MRRFVLLVVVLAGLGGPAVAEPYWIAWEGEDWPENEGWTRDIRWGGDERALADGVMTLDGIETQQGYGWDGYEGILDGTVDPGPGETFIVQWRMRVSDVRQGNWDPAVYVFSDDSRALALNFSESRLWSVFEGPAALVSFAPGVFHAYEVRSVDMQSYQLLIDGETVRIGAFGQGVTPRRLGWGDCFSPAGSTSTWDYVRFGVVPEPASVFVLFTSVAVARGVLRDWLVR